MRTKSSVVGAITMMVFSDLLACGAAEIVVIDRNNGRFRWVV
jgi:hypothetical protein